MLKSNPVYETREIQKVTGVPTIAAKDGMVVDPLAYSFSSKQSKLLY